MKYTKKEAQAKIDQLDDQIVKLMSEMDAIRANTIDSDKEDFEALINQFEECSERVKVKFYNYVVDTHRMNFGLFV